MKMETVISIGRAETRMTRCQTEVCKKLQMSEEDFKMMLFESGCQRADDICQRLPITLQAQELTASNEYWYWWTKHFLTIAEVWLMRPNGNYEALSKALSVVIVPMPQQLDAMAREIRTKKAI